MDQQKIIVTHKHKNLQKNIFSKLNIFLIIINNKKHLEANQKLIKFQKN